MDFKRYLLRGRSWYDMRDLVVPLRYFRFVRSPGGHLDEGDSLRVAFRYEDEDDLCALMEALSGTPHRESAHVVLAGAEVFAFPRRGTLSLHISGADGDRYEVTRADADHALRVEPLLDPFADRLIDPPVGGRRCVAPSTWPEFWEE